jgi:hypothetical protein
MKRFKYITVVTEPMKQVPRPIIRNIDSPLMGKKFINDASIVIPPTNPAKKYVPWNPRPMTPQGIPSPFVKRKTVLIPAKWIRGTDTSRMLQHGELRYEGTGRTCGECVNCYYDRVSEWYRCRAKGFKRIHQEWPADHVPKSWTDPMTGEDVPAGFERCPFFISRERYSSK